MYIIYNSTTGEIYRHVTRYIEEPEHIKASTTIDGPMNLIYPMDINPAILKISDEKWNSMDKGALSKYIVSDNTIVLKQNYSASGAGLRVSQGGEIFNDYINNIASEVFSRATGYKTKARAICSSANGCGTESDGYASRSDGLGTKSKGIASSADGNDTIASQDFAHSEGDTTHAGGIGAHSEGGFTEALGRYSHSENYKTLAKADASHSEGWETVALGIGSHSEGFKTMARGYAAHSEGFETFAPGYASHSEGNKTIASGDSAHSEGAFTEASGPQTHSEGLGTIARSRQQHVQGRYNIIDNDGLYAHILGNGTDDNNRSNAHTIDWDGNAWYAGSVECDHIVLKSPNGTRFKLTISDDGELLTSKI